MRASRILAVLIALATVAVGARSGLADTVYIANDSSVDTISVASTTLSSGNPATTLTGSVSPNDPHQIAVVGNDLLVADGSNIAEFNATTGVTDTLTLLNSASSDFATTPEAVAVTSSDIFVAGYSTGYIDEFAYSFNPNGTIKIGAESIISTNKSQIYSLAVVGSTIYAGSLSDVYAFNFSGSTIDDTPIAGSEPIGVAYYDGDLFVTMESANKVVAYNGTTGVVEGTISSGTSGPAYLAFDGNDLLVTNHGDGSVTEYGITVGSSGGSVTATSPVTNYITGVSAPYGIAVVPSVGGNPVPLPAPVWSCLGLIGIVGAMKAMRAKQAA